MKRFTKAVCFCLILCFGFFSGCSNKDVTEPLPAAELYKRAVVDAMVADTDEILPLVNLDKSDNRVTFNEEGKVLVGRWHRHYDKDCFCSLEGKETVSGSGYMFLFSLKEMQDWAKKETNVADMTLRLEQLIGLPPKNGYVEFSFFYADIKDLIRPAYCYNPSVNDLKLEFCDHTKDDADYIKWFNDNILSSYYSKWQYPWTRLGYTYDWADNGVEYGLTEFLVKPKSNLFVELTFTNEEFFAFLKG